MRIGLIARADNGGLGAQTLEFYRWLKPTKTMVVDISGLNGYANQFDRYPDAQIVHGFPKTADFDEFLRDIDVVLTVEIPYGYQLFDMARQRGIKTALQYNYEFLDYLQDITLPAPDLLLAPSKWHIGEVEVIADRIGAKLVHIPVPVNRDLIRYRPRSGNTLLHVAGHKAFEDRNGTNIVLDAMKYIKNDVELIITTQDGGEAGRINAFMSHARKHGLIRDNVEFSLRNGDYRDYQDIWNEIDADLLLLPRRYGGLSLQLNEAMAAGMVPITSRVEPQSLFLPPFCMVEPRSHKSIQTRTLLECYDVDPEAYAERIDNILNHKHVQLDLSRQMDELANEISWDNLVHTYWAALERLMI